MRIIHIYRTGRRDIVKPCCAALIKRKESNQQFKGLWIKKNQGDRIFQLNDAIIINNNLTRKREESKLTETRQVNKF
jgi:ribosomal protein L20